MRRCAAILVLFIMSCHHNGHQVSASSNTDHARPATLDAGVLGKIQSSVFASNTTDSTSIDTAHCIAVADSTGLFALFFEKVTKRHQWDGSGLVYLYDAGTNKLSTQPYVIPAHYFINDEEELSKMLTRPLYYFRQGAHKELVIKHRVHNGNIYNAVIEWHYSVDTSALSLTSSFQFETLFEDPFDSVYFKRELTGNNVSVYLLKSVDDKAPQLVATYEIESYNPLKIKNRRIYLDRWEYYAVPPPEYLKY